MTIKAISRTEEIAWSGHPKTLKLKRKPQLSELEANFEKLEKAIASVIKWYEAEIDNNNYKEYYEGCKLLVSLFGFDPYVGDLYRAIPILKKVDKIPVEGKILRLKATVSKLSSWTTSLSNAARYGSHAHKSYVVIRARQQVLQLMNSNYLKSIAKYLLSIPQIRSKSPIFSKLEKTMTRFEAEDEVTGMTRPRMLVEVVFVRSKSLPFVRKAF